MTAVRIFLLASLALATMAPRCAAQLRPLDPVDFDAFSGPPMRATVGAAVYDDQRASLAGTQGRLWEIGNLRFIVRTGRVLIDAGGTIQRLFSEDSVWAAPYGDAAPPAADRKRHDAGDYRIAAVVRLTGDSSPTLGTLRFGTRLPTTDNLVGLDRDATDFFTTLGAHREFGRLRVSAEAGLSINGTRKTTYEQSDVFIYALNMQVAFGRLTPYITAVGQEDFHDHAVRGNEDLGEQRVGLRAGLRRWIDVALVRGYRQFSPDIGFQFGVGTTF